MSKYHWHICVTSVGLDELPKKRQANMYDVATVLAKTGRFSVFEATANQTIARTMDRIENSGWFDRTTEPYPWISVKLTDKGRQVLANVKRSRNRKR